MPWESRILVEARLDVVLLAVLDDQVIDLAGRHARCDSIRADVADFRTHPTRLAHTGDFGLALDVDFQGYITLRKFAATLSTPVIPSTVLRMFLPL